MPSSGSSRRRRRRSPRCSPVAHPPLDRGGGHAGQQGLLLPQRIDAAVLEEAAALQETHDALGGGFDDQTIGLPKESARCGVPPRWPDGAATGQEGHGGGPNPVPEDPHNRRANPMAAFQTIWGLAAQAGGPTHEQLYAVGDRGGWVHPNA